MELIQSCLELDANAEEVFAREVIEQAVIQADGAFQRPRRIRTRRRTGSINNLALAGCFPELGTGRRVVVADDVDLVERVLHVGEHRHTETVNLEGLLQPEIDLLRPG